MQNKEKQNKDILISTILDEIKELELVTKGMQDPTALQDLAIKKTKNLLAQFKELKELQASSKEAIDENIQTVVSKVTEEGNPVETITPYVPQKEIKVEKENEPEKRTTPTAPVLPTAKPEEKEQHQEKVAIVMVEEPKTIETKIETVSTPETHEVEQAPKDVVETVEPEETPVETPKQIISEPVAEEKQPAKNNNSELHNYINSGRPTMNDQFKMQNNQTEVIQGKVEMRFKQSLKQMMSLNDKIRLSKSLAKGDMSKITKLIEAIDEMSDINAAISYAKSNLEWDDEKEAVKEFVEKLNRRFA